jgi:hypothetical protein
MRHCIVCEKDVQPTIDISESGRPIDHCPMCATALGLPQGPDRVVTVADKGITEVPVDRAPPPGGTPGDPQDDPHTAAGGSAQAPTTGVRRVDPLGRLAPRPTGDFLHDVQTRIKVIDIELVRLAGLQRERRRLAAMVAAAEAADAEDPEPEPATTTQAAAE